MRAVVVYESMYGNTHLVASAIGQALAEHGEVWVVPVEEATPNILDGVDLLVVGGPTHVHAMSTKTSRHSAADVANKPDSDVELDPDSAGPGLRDWFGELDPLSAEGAAFDTRMDLSPVVTGRASKGIARRLRHHGVELVVEPESFLVTKDNHLEPGEEAHARAWGARVANAFADRSATASS